mmetsp:Transcript_27402/g.47974  ORF Transcript_27402/g.47974 Transcript_27402/m.47974 type:complete len:145 (+) Transcript_27402:719-1153(+)
MDLTMPLGDVGAPQPTKPAGTDVEDRLLALGEAGDASHGTDQGEAKESAEAEDSSTSLPLRSSGDKRTLRRALQVGAGGERIRVKLTGPVSFSFAEFKFSGSNGFKRSGPGGKAQVALLRGASAKTIAPKCSQRRTGGISQQVP